jgi:serpin B
MIWFNRLVLASITICTAFTSFLMANRDEQCFPRREIHHLHFWTQGNKKFTTTFYQQAKINEQNFVFSPISLQLALSMASELAVGATREEILDKAALPKTAMIRHAGAKRILKQLNTGVAAGGEHVTLAFANGAWLSTTTQFPSSFNPLLQEAYQATLNPADFRHSSEKVRNEINGWVEEKTLQQIKNFVPKGSITPQTKLVLVNTLYMRAPWKKAFNPEYTHDESFYGEQMESSIPFMHQRGMFGYYEAKKCEVIELPFQNSNSTTQLSLFVVLPKEEYSLEDIEKSLLTNHLQQVIKTIKPRMLDLSLPKFKVSSVMNAKKHLQNLGMQLPFSQEAEFNLSDEEERVVITDIVHHAVFEIDEIGGTGAAGTAITIGATCARPDFQAVNVNRPFLIFVADKKSGIVLFAGRIMQPTIE